ncbi:MAG: clan AA aspartic protease [Actinobacteria bacterium]|nr:clan AA aspartic protease [Actinomycetota bacterium]
MITVPATLNDSDDLALIADTGAERTVISRAVAIRLGLDLLRPLRLQPLVGVGRSPPVPVVRLDRVRVGASTVSGVEASVFDLPRFFRADGLLGLNFLRRFRVTFAFDAGILILREPPTR